MLTLMGPVCGGLAVPGAFYGVPSLLHAELHLAHGQGQIWAYDIAGLFLAVCVIVLLIVIGSAIRGVVRSGALIPLLLGGLVCGGFVYPLARHRETHWPWWKILTTLLLSWVAVGAAAVIVVLLATALLRALSRRYMSATWPGEFIISRLIDAIVYIQAKERKLAISALEDVAVAIERDLAQVPLGADLATLAWVEAETRQIANAVRELKRLVLVSSSSRLERATTELVQMLELAAGGEWASLSRSAVDIPPRNRAKAVLGFVAVVAVGGLPLGALAVLQQTDAAVHGSLRSYLFAAAGIWALVNFLFEVDPRLPERIEVFREVLRSSQPEPS